ncbi:MAG: L-threonylcarbamoyladenylate synthase [Candidatus Tectomicrobia bacterium]
MSRCLPLDPSAPDAAVIQEAAGVLRHGGVVAYPTDTVYGLAVDAMNETAIARLYAIKRRPVEKALPLIIGALAQLTQVSAGVPSRAEPLIASFWPGPLTLLLEPHERVPALLLGNSDRIGVRWPHALISQQLALAVGRAITASSANISGAPVALCASEVVAQLAPTVDLILDGGPVPSAAVSTILDVTVDPPCLLRAGKIAPSAIEAVLGGNLAWPPPGVPHSPEEPGRRGRSR